MFTVGGWGSFFRCKGGGKRRRNRGGSVAWCYINFHRWNHQRKYSVGERVMSLYGDPGLNPSVILSVKSPVKTSTSSTCFFFSLKILNSPLVIMSVYTDKITKRFTFFSKYHHKLPTEKLCR